MKNTLIILICISILSIFPVISQSQQPELNIRISARYHLDGDENWDYLTVDEEGGMLYVSHGDKVQVMSLQTGVETARIEGTKGVHGIAIAREFNRGYTSNGEDSSVTVFDLKTFKIITKINTNGSNPDAILYDPFSKRIFVFNGKSSNCTVLDAKSGKIAATISLDGNPEAAVSNGSGRIYVNIKNRNLVAEIDASKLRILNQWPVMPGNNPTGITMDKKNNRLFIVCENRLMVILDANSGQQIREFPIGENADGVVFDPAASLVFCSNGDGTLSIIREKNPQDFELLENFITQKGARTIAIDTRTHHLYLPVAGFDEFPDPSGANPRARRHIRPGTFTILDIMTIQ